jgi:hypothetical protein
MIRPIALAAVLASLLVGSVLTLTLAGAGPLASDEKPAEREVSEKGTPVPSQRPGKSDGWTIVPPEERTDITLIDVEDARLSLPGPGAAAGCDNGELDPDKASKVIRDWLAANKSDMPFTRVWDGALVLVVCQYPNDEQGDKVRLNIGIPNDGYSYLAPEACVEEMVDVPSGAALPADCVPPDEVGVPFDIWRATILVDPSVVLQSS